MIITASTISRAKSGNFIHAGLVVGSAGPIGIFALTIRAAHLGPGARVVRHVGARVLLRHRDAVLAGRVITGRVRAALLVVGADAGDRCGAGHRQRLAGLVARVLAKAVPAAGLGGRADPHGGGVARRGGRDAVSSGIRAQWIIAALLGGGTDTRDGGRAGLRHWEAGLGA